MDIIPTNKRNVRSVNILVKNVIPQMIVQNASQNEFFKMEFVSKTVNHLSFLIQIINAKSVQLETVHNVKHLEFVQSVKMALNCSITIVETVLLKLNKVI